MCKSQPTDDKPSLVGTWSGHVTHYRIFGATIISLERLLFLKLKSSNFVHEYAISILTTGWHITNKKGVVMVA